MINIENYIEEQLQDIDIRNIVAQEVRKQTEKEVYSTIKRLTEREILTIIKQEIDIALNGAVKTDDGWGKREEYQSFSELFRKTFAAKLNNSWDMKKTIKKTIEEKVSKLYAQNKQEVIDKVVKELEQTY